MTTGMSLPAAADAQREFVRRLSEAGLAGLAIGDDLLAPPLTQDMLAEADEQCFPVVSVGHATPFVAIGRTVAIAAQSVQVSRIARLSRLYDATQAAPEDETSLLDRVSAELGHRLHVVDVELGSEVLRDARPLGDDLVDELRRSVGAGSTVFRRGYRSTPAPGRWRQRSPSPPTAGACSSRPSTPTSRSTRSCCCMRRASSAWKWSG